MPPVGFHGERAVSQCHQAAGEITPFRDLFAVLFFVSVGMLLDPSAMVADWPALLALLVVATVGKAAIGAGLGRAFGMPLRSALLLGAVVAQVGEFSFLLAEQALHLGLLDARGYNLVLGTAVVSIVLTPILVAGAVRLIERLEHGRLIAEPPTEAAGGFSRWVPSLVIAMPQGGLRGVEAVAGDHRRHARGITLSLLSVVD